MRPLKTLTSKTLVLTETSIDTDQIIPARFLTTTERSGLGRCAFADWRFDDAGQLRDDSVLNQDAAHGAEILVAGDNFGCGSSREHAVWALMDFGFRAVISSRLADIFRANSLKNGLLAIEVEPEIHRWLLDHPGASTTLDVERRTLSVDGGPACEFDLDPFARSCLLEGVDAMGWLLSRVPDIESWENERQEAA